MVFINEKIKTPLISQTVQLLSGKWKLQIITFLINHGTTRFMGLQRGVCGITSRVLSKELHALEQADFISRIVTAPKTNSVQYELTPHGKTLESVIRCLAEWGTVNFNHQDLNCEKEKNVTLL